MTGRTLRPLLAIALAVAVVTACGGGDDDDVSSSGASDVTADVEETVGEPFAALAPDVCATFASDLVAVREQPMIRDQFAYADVYREASASLGAAVDGEDPVQDELVAAMETAADAWEEFHAALSAALDEIVDPGVTYTVSLTASGEVYIAPDGDIFMTQHVGIDPTIYTGATDAEAAVAEAATALALTECSPNPIGPEAADE